MIVLSSFATPEAQIRILSLQGCTVSLIADDVGNPAKEFEELGPHMRFVHAPELDELLNEDPADSVEYQKSWEDGKDDPWLIFHTSGTTGSSLSPG